MTSNNVELDDLSVQRVSSSISEPRGDHLSNKLSAGHTIRDSGELHPNTILTLAKNSTTVVVPYSTVPRYPLRRASALSDLTMKKPSFFKRLSLKFKIWKKLKLSRSRRKL